MVAIVSTRIRGDDRIELVGDDGKEYHFINAENAAYWMGANTTGLPTLASISPTTAVSGAADTTVTLTGTNFNTSSQVLVNNVVAQRTYVSPTSMTTVLPVSQVVGHRLWQISVRNGVYQTAARPFSLTTTAAAPVFTVEAAITGTETVGQTLTCTSGTVTGSPTPTITKQWKRTGANIPGAIADSYLLDLPDQGEVITCLVTASNASGSAASIPSTGIIAASGGGGGAPDAPTSVTWVSAASDTTPDFSMTLTGAVADDELVGQYSADGAGVWNAYFSHTLTAPEILAEAATVGGATPLAEGAWDFRFRIERGAAVSAWSSTVDATINFAPTVSAFSPLDNSTGVAVSVSPTVTFNKPVQFGTGNITLKLTSDNSTIEAFNVATEVGTGNGQVSISGAVLTINPTSDLASGTGHYILIDATAIENLNDIAFAGIAATTTWNFATTGGWLTIWNKTTEMSTAATDAGGNGYTMVTVIPRVNITGGGVGTKARVTFSGGATEGVELSGAYIANGGGANAYSGTLPVRLGTTVTAAAAGSVAVESGPFVDDGTNAILISVQMQNAAADNPRYLAVGSGSAWYKGPATADAATQAKSGYTDYTPKDVISVTKIELFT